jgi:diguanylate cyclase (GGDEF)-like protein
MAEKGAAQKKPRTRVISHVRRLQRQYRLLLFCLVLVVALVYGVVYLQNLTAERQVYESYTRDSILAIKKDFLKDNVSNVIRIIDEKRQTQETLYRERTRRIAARLALFAQYSPESFAALCVGHFSLEESQQAFSVLLFSPEGALLLRRNVSDDMLASEGDSGQTLIANHFPVRHEETYAGHRVVFGVSQQALDEEVKAQAAELIHQSRFSNDAYIWVNEIINYEGGTDYAVRRVHPNLPETEGMLLSTDMTDIQGNLPYLEELEGIRADGEIFFTYFFKKLNQETISEKLTYARLYEPFDWVVAMGIHLDDVQAYLDLSIQENQEHLRQLTIRMALLLAGILIVAFLMLLWLERWYFRSTSRTWKTQTHVDPLTGVANRRAGIELLEDAFRRSKDSPDSPCLMMMDIDDFKHVNDTHGHPVGDEVLKTLTRRINENIRSTDTLCRWGGEEFMLFCEHLPRDRSLSLAEKLLEAVRAETFGSPDDPWRVTISIGISWHGPADREAEAAVIRADKALYTAKHAGKDQAIVLAPDEA